MYAVKLNSDKSLSARKIIFAADLLQDEVLFGGELINLTDTAFDPVVGLRSKTKIERLEDVKHLAYARIKQWACDAFSAGFETTLEIKMDCDVQSIAALHALHTFGMVQGVRSLTICDFDNVTHFVSWDEFEKLLLETGAHHQKIYARKWELRQLASKAESEKDLDALSWE